MIRYAISPIKGSGTIADPYRAAAADVAGVNSASVIPTQANGQPKWRFCLAVLASAQFSSVQAIANLYLMPDYSLDGQLSGMEAGARAAMVQSVEAYDLDGNGTHLTVDNTDTDGYRALLSSLGTQLDPSFSLASFGTPEVSQ